MNAVKRSLGRRGADLFEYEELWGCSQAPTVAQSVRHAVAIAMSMIAAVAWLA
ncbi:hypothetical protein [Salinibacterium sp. ZJ454]|uniref:hypothetical protein n=1 Tax=Salinibacterium sp. ZJ454 TaxID=2708339 RepID=UPI00141E6747|nr:hypothetical protein [Salinibacterium sp. ZJ454]